MSVIVIVHTYGFFLGLSRLRNDVLEPRVVSSQFYDFSTRCTVIRLFDELMNLDNDNIKIYIVKFVNNYYNLLKYP